MELEVLTIHDAHKRAGIYPDGLDIFDKIYARRLVVPAGNTAVPVSSFIKFDANAYFFLYSVTASYESSAGRAATFDDSPAVVFKDLRNGKILSESSNNNIQLTTDKYIKVQGSFTPGLITEPLANNNLAYPLELIHLFAPLSQMEINVINPAGSIGLNVDFIFKGYVVRVGKV